VAHCEFCGSEIGYLPFKCKYCGAIYCKKHRLPENHQCTFELKHTPVVPISPRISDGFYTKGAARKGGRKTSDFEKVREKKSRSTQRKASDFRNPKELKRYLDRERKYREQARRIVERSLSGRDRARARPRANEAPGTTFLMITIISLSIVAMFLPPYLCLTVYWLTHYYIWTLFTSIFISYTGDMFGLFFLIFSIFIFSNIARNIELRFGTKFFMSLYLLSTTFSLLFYILIRLLLVFIFPIEFGNAVPVGFAMGGILGLIAFIIFLDPDREMTLICLIIPVKMRARAILLLLTLPYLLLGLLLGLIMSPLYFAVYFPNLAGVLASYLVYYAKYRFR